MISQEERAALRRVGAHEQLMVQLESEGLLDRDPRRRSLDRGLGREESRRARASPAPKSRSCWSMPSDR